MSLPSSRLIRLLFICAGNSCRSQMAEAWARHLRGDRIDAYSAGVEVHGLNRVAVRVMAEAGIDISHYRSKRIEELRNMAFDYVVAVCDAGLSCPVPPGGAPVLRAPFDDPPALARNASSDDEALAHYRRVRDEIRAFVETLPESLERAQGPFEGPIAMAAVETGETVAVVGCGEGADVFAAARAAGDSGYAIGIDTDPSAVAAARRLAQDYRKTSGCDNVEFRLGEFEYLPMVESTADVLVARCAVSRANDPLRVWRELFRVLKPGGRLVSIDMAAIRSPARIRPDTPAAVDLADIEPMAEAAGFVSVECARMPAISVFDGATVGRYPKSEYTAICVRAIKPQ